jgi:hypothetical protein
MSRSIGMDYDTALIHLKTCEHVKHPCKMQCGTMLYNSEIEEHRKKCPNYHEACEKCGMVFYPNRG